MLVVCGYALILLIDRVIIDSHAQQPHDEEKQECTADILNGSPKALEENYKTRETELDK